MTRFCVDTSAWHRSTAPQVAAVWRHHLEADELVLCDQVRLEILYSARSARDYDDLSQELAGMSTIPTDDSTFERALEVQQLLAHVGGLPHRSVKITDLIIAAAAEAAHLPVLHYNSDYDRIAAVTSQPVQWIVPLGSL